MKILIKNLADTPLAEITRCFNEAFSDYFIQFSATENYLRKRWQKGRVKYDLSFGSFVDGTLKGFIVHGIDNREGRRTAHNCATVNFLKSIGRKNHIDQYEMEREI